MNRLEVYRLFHGRVRNSNLIVSYEHERSFSGISMPKDSFEEGETIVFAAFSTTDVHIFRISRHGASWSKANLTQLNSIRVNHSSITSICMNPFAGGSHASCSLFDVVIATRDGAIWAWEGYNSSRLRLIKVSDESDDTAEPHIVWGAHPRLILVAQGSKVYEIDLRTSASHLRVLWGVSEDGSKESESILGLSRISGSPERFNFILATDHHIILLDSRYPRRALLKWRHRLRSVCPGLLHACAIGDEFPGQNLVFLACGEVDPSPAAIYVWQFELARPPEPSNEGLTIDNIVDLLIDDEENDESTLPFKRAEPEKFSFGPLCPRWASLPMTIPVFDLVIHRIGSLRMFDIQAFGCAVWFSSRSQAHASVRCAPASSVSTTRKTQKSRARPKKHTSDSEDDDEDDESDSGSRFSHSDDDADGDGDDDEDSDKMDVESKESPKVVTASVYLNILHASAAGDVFYQQFGILDEKEDTDPLNSSTSSPPQNSVDSPLSTASSNSASQLLLKQLEQRTLAPKKYNEKGRKTYTTVDLSKVLKYMINHRVLPDKDDERRRPKKAPPKELKDFSPKSLAMTMMDILRFLRSGQEKEDARMLPPRTLAEITAHLLAKHPQRRPTHANVKALLDAFMEDPEEVLGNFADQFDEQDRIYTVTLQHSTTALRADVVDADVVERTSQLTAPALVLYALQPFGPTEAEEQQEQAAAAAAAAANNDASLQNPTMTSLLASQGNGSFLSQTQQKVLSQLMERYKQSQQQQQQQEEEDAENDEVDDGAEATEQSSGKRKKQKQKKEEKKSMRNRLDQMRSLWAQTRPSSASAKPNDDGAGQGDDEEQAGTVDLSSAGVENSVRKSFKAPPSVPKPTVPSSTPAVKSRRGSSVVAPTQAASRAPSVPVTPVAAPPTIRGSSQRRGVVLSPPSSQWTSSQQQEAGEDFLAPATQNTQENPFSSPMPRFSSQPSWVGRSSFGGFGSPVDPANTNASGSVGFGSVGFGSQSFQGFGLIGSPPASQQQSQNMFGSPFPSSQPK